MDLCDCSDAAVDALIDSCRPLSKVPAEEWGPGEAWLPIPGFEGRYEISSLGRVWGCYRRRLRRLPPDRDGYPKVHLSRGRARKQAYAHRLVMAAFVGPCPAGRQVAHWDGNPSNPALANLRYATPRDNNLDKVRHGTHQAGEANPCSHLTDADVLAIRSSADSAAEAGRRFGVSKTQICRIRRGLSWGHIGGPRSTPAPRRLTADDVRDIRTSDDGVVRVARRLGVSHTTVSDARRRKTFKHIP